MRLKSQIENGKNADINEEGMKHCMHEEYIYQLKCTAINVKAH